jgi:uncharacterized RDD family membrane protein YckC
MTENAAVETLKKIQAAILWLCIAVYWIIFPLGLAWIVANIGRAVNYICGGCSDILNLMIILGAVICVIAVFWITDLLERKKGRRWRGEA